LTVQIQDRLHGVIHREDETSGALGFWFDTAIEPHWTVETGLLVHQNVGEFIVEALCIFFGSKIAVLSAPSRDRIDHAADHLAHAVFSLRTSQGAAKIF